jgi:hypothetical protein
MAGKTLIGREPRTTGNDAKTSARYDRLRDKADSLTLDLVADNYGFRITHRDKDNALNRDGAQFETLAEVSAFLRGFDHGHSPKTNLKLYRDE